MASKMLGIEIGSDSLKMALVKKGTVTAMAAERLPDHLVREGRVVSPATMSQFVKTMLKKYRLPKGDCALVLPPQVVVAQRLTMPVMSEAELKLNLPYEFRDYVGKDASEYDFDYIVIGINDGVMDLYAAAVRRQLVEDYYAIFKKAGLTLKVAMPAEMAWLNIIANCDNAPRKLCIVDIGHRTTRVNIFEHGNYVMGKDIEYAGQLLDETIAAELGIDSHAGRTHKETNNKKVQSADFIQGAYGTVALEIMKALSFFNYSSTSEDGELQDLYYCGGCASIEPLRTAIIKSTGMTAHHVCRLLNMTETVSDMALSCALAAGAGLQNQ